MERHEMKLHEASHFALARRRFQEKAARKVQGRSGAWFSRGTSLSSARATIGGPGLAHHPAIQADVDVVSTKISSTEVIEVRRMG